MQHRRSDRTRARRAGAVLLALALLASGFEARSAQAPEEGLRDWFPRLRVGMWVRAEGPRTPEGVLQAASLRIYDGERDEVQVESHVTTVDLVRMRIETTAGVRIVATPTTRVEGPRQNRNASLAYIGPGDRIEVEGQLQKDGSLLAEKIDIERSRRVLPDYQPLNWHEVTARIETIDGGNARIVVLKVPVLLEESTRFRSSVP